MGSTSSQKVNIDMQVLSANLSRGIRGVKKRRWVGSCTKLGRLLIIKPSLGVKGEKHIPIICLTCLFRDRATVSFSIPLSWGTLEHYTGWTPSKKKHKLISKSSFMNPRHFVKYIVLDALVHIIIDIFCRKLLKVSQLTSYPSSTATRSTLIKILSSALS